MTDLPNCPLCGAAPHRATNAPWLCYCAERACAWHNTLIPEKAWRALAALRKPRRDQRKRDVRPWRIEVFQLDDGRWLARWWRRYRKDPHGRPDLFTVGQGDTREAAVRDAVKMLREFIAAGWWAARRRELDGDKP